MIITKFKKQHMDLIKSNQPDLYASIMAHFKDLTEEQQGRVAGFVIEFVLKSGGSYGVFDDTFSDLTVEEGGEII